MRAHQNPFRSARLARLPFRGADGVAAVAERWGRMGCRGAIVGPHGSGKTTLLRALAAELESRGFRAVHVFANARCRPQGRELLRRARGLGPGDVLLFDGAEQLTRLGWWRLLRAAGKAGGIVATAHDEGRLPTLARTATDPELLDALLGELLGDGSAGGLALARSLFEHHRGNLHDVLLGLYDLAARDDPRLVAPGSSPRA